MKLLLILGMSFAVCAQAADFQGRWSGTGSYESREHGAFPAAAAELEFLRMGAEDALFQECWKFQRDGSAWKYCHTYDLFLRNGEVWMGHEKIGTYDANGLTIAHNYLSLRTQAELRFHADGTVDYFLEATDTQGLNARRQARGLARQ